MMAPNRIKLAWPLLLFFSCAKDKGILDHGNNYPVEIASILLTKCATSGCHDNTSKNAAAGLSLAAWSHLFEGSRNGSVIIPYRPDFSTLCFYTNAYPDLGQLLEPRMPLNGSALTREECLSLKKWIEQGAPDVKGLIKFKDARNKLYITNQLCDLVTVVDGESKLPMRYVDVGAGAKTEFPVCIKTSADKKYWYVTFLASTIIQKFDAATDSYLGQLDLGEGVWTSFEITADSKYAFSTDNNSPGKIACIDLDKMKVIRYYNNPYLVYPRGVAIHNKAGKLYVGAENGNYITVVNFTDPASPVIKQIILDGSASPNYASSNDPVAICLDETSNQCFVGCRNSMEIKLVDTQKDVVASTLPLNAAPAAMAYSADTKKLFVSCTDDSISFPGSLGSVKIISTPLNQVVKTIYPGYQPNGICVNSAYGYVAVVNSNISPKGPRPHHSSGCAGRNGYITYIDLNTLELIPDMKYELAVYPFAMALTK